VLAPTTIPTSQLFSPLVSTTQGMRFPSLHYNPSNNLHHLQGSNTDYPRISKPEAPRNPVAIGVLTTTFTHAILGNFSIEFPHKHGSLILNIIFSFKKLSSIPTMVAYSFPTLNFGFPKFLLLLKTTLL
jgi:hypothetical protein